VSDVIPDRNPNTRVSGAADSVEGLVATTWSVRSAIGLVLLALALTLLAGAIVSQMGTTTWSPALHAFAAGCVLLGLYAALVGIVWGMATTSGVRLSEAVGLAHTVSSRWYAAAVGSAIVGWAFSAGYVWALTALGVRMPAENVAVLTLLARGPVGVAMTVVLLVVAAPIAEEIIYRGVLLPSLDERWGVTVGLVASAAVFSAVHLSVVGFVPLMGVGLLFGWLFMKSRSLRVAMVAHAAFNAIGLGAMLAFKSSGIW
jgi:membrane protease YdiL (CAAX protease family)